MTDSKYSFSEALDFSSFYNVDLLTITSSDENTFVSELIQSNINNSYVWLGASDENSEGSWYWINGERLNYSNWDNGEPIIKLVVKTFVNYDRILNGMTFQQQLLKIFTLF